MSNPNHIPKLSVEITQEQHLRMQRLLPHGFRKIIFSIMIDDLCDLVEEHGELVLGALAKRAVDIRVLKTIGSAVNAKNLDAKEKHK